MCSAIGKNSANAATDRLNPRTLCCQSLAGGPNSALADFVDPSIMLSHSTPPWQVLVSEPDWRQPRAEGPRPFLARWPHSPTVRPRSIRPPRKLLSQGVESGKCFRIRLGDIAHRSGRSRHKRASRSLAIVGASDRMNCRILCLAERRSLAAIGANECVHGPPDMTRGQPFRVGRALLHHQTQLFHRRTPRPSELRVVPAHLPDRLEDVGETKRFALDKLLDHKAKATGRGEGSQKLAPCSAGSRWLGSRFQGGLRGRLLTGWGKLLPRVCGTGAKWRCK